MMDIPTSYNLTLVAAAAGLFGTAQSFRLNSVYDPEVAFGPNSPYQYSAIASIWRAYRVHAVTIDAYFSEPSADGMYVAAGIYNSVVTPNISGQTPTTVDQKQMVDLRALNNTGMQTVRITRRINLWDAEGQRREEWIADPNYAALFGANPASCPVVNVAVAGIAGTPQANCLMRLIFHTEVYGLVAA